MTNATMQALEDVLRSFEPNDDYVSKVADALAAYRADGGPMAENALRNAAMDYAEMVNKPFKIGDAS